jgi:valyl-tRNA synthetase
MLEKNFEPKSFEKNFSFEIEASVRKPEAESFMILLPPPNITGSLHIGHSLCYTLQDILARYKRLKGFDVLFQPGLDHAGIVTQLLVEKQLYESGAEKGSLTRETLLKEIWTWKENSGYKILEQMKILGISCDFSRLRFTMDEDAKKAVTKLFVALFEDGLLFKGERMVNWDPLICSAISDLEVTEKEVDGNLWHIKYMLENSYEFVAVATSRPETLFGDVAVAVNPSDNRYRHLIGKNVVIPLINKAIPIIEDNYADPQKGSGAVKITPAHDFNDFEVGKRHNLPIINILNESAELNDNVPDIFRRLDRFEARKMVVDMLQQRDLIVKVDQIKQMLPFGDRSGVILEPRITNQWFVNTEKLAEAAIKVVKEGKIKFIPKHWENLYFEWLNNIKPWCISRQIWWGHRIPAWYGVDGQIFVDESLEKAHAKAVKFYGKNGVELTQDNDVMDTWFSSGMWPFVTLGWPNDTEEIKRYYSNMIVVTGFDIIFFWVSRMIMFGLYTMKEVPFKDVYIHGLVRDEKGKKMSKSKGNVIDPLDLCNEYGADAVRYTLASMSSPGRDLKMTNKSVEIGRNFLTKLWNIVRFSQMNGCIYNKDFDIGNINNHVSKWIIFKIKKMVQDVESSIENYRFDEAVSHIYHCMWDSFCDWFIEFSKHILQHTTIVEESKTGYDLDYTLLKKDIRDTTSWAILQFVSVLYPITPFISKKLSGELGVLEINWPNVKDMDADFEQSVLRVESLKEIITSVRAMKQCLNIPLSEKMNAKLETLNEDVAGIIEEYSDIIEKMAGVKFTSNVSRNTVPVVITEAIIYLEFGEKIDVRNEENRIKNEIAKLEKAKQESLTRLSNSDFLSKASEEIVQEHKERVEKISEKIQRMEYVVKTLGTI